MSDHPSSSSQKSVWIAIAGVILVFAIFVSALRMTGFLSFSGTDSSAKIVAAGIALFGAFVGTLVTFAGILLKHSLDQRIENRLQVESQRNDVLQKDAEQRSKLEAAIRAVQLLATSNGNLAPSIQRTGALFTLSSLGQHDLALTLTSELLTAGLLEPRSVARLINQALIAGNDAEKERAIDIFHEHADRMLTPEGAEFPTCLLEGTNNLSLYVRGWTPIAFGKLLLARPLAEWTAAQYYAAGILGALAVAWLEETDEVIKNDAGEILRYALRAFPEVGKIQLSKIYMDVDRLRAEVENVSAATSAGEEIVARLEAWCK